MKITENTQNKTDIASYDYSELKTYMDALGQPGYRTQQLYQWMHQKLAAEFDEMSNLPKALREQLSRQCRLSGISPVRVQVSELDGTAKYLFKLHDGNLIESVLMHYRHGSSVCVSSQAGCRMGCAFCASTLDGCVRSLSPSEMLGQVYNIQKLSGCRVSHVVVMGSGEPLDNYDNLLRFLRMLSDENGLNISMRNITVSTCGIVPKILSLADEKLPITLAVSLHAPNDEIRKTLMPVARKYPLAELLEACRTYLKKTNRRITFEYSLVKGVNDAPSCARELSGLLKGMNCHVNLIPVNPIKERNFRQSGQREVLEFKNMLEKYGINATIRREMGRDIQGACGQLRKSCMDNE